MNVDIVALGSDTDSDAKRQENGMSQNSITCAVCNPPPPPRFLWPINSCVFYHCTCLCSEVSHLLLNICAKSQMCGSWISCHISLICDSHIWQKHLKFFLLLPQNSKLFKYSKFWTSICAGGLFRRCFLYALQAKYRLSGFRLEA